VRRIDPDYVRYRLPQAWKDRARDAAARIQAAYDRLYGEPAQTPEEQRARRKALSDAVDAESDVWQDRALKQILMEASNGKCWYCEAAVAQRADNPVDHFRPKNRVHGEDHPGYFWLACDWENYRFSCTFCNSSRRTDDTVGGKQDFFPLWDAKQRGRPPRPDVSREQPMLLDPIDLADAGFITFDLNGNAVPRYSKDDNEYLHERAVESIARYHLNRPDYRDRRRSLMDALDKAITDADRYRQRFKGNDVTAEQAYRTAVRTIVEKIKPTAEFTAAGRAALASRRGSSDTANDLLSGGWT
jgi:hypothetical protein